MEVKDIKEFELGEHCFGDILRVNGVDYDDLKKDDVIEFILDMFKNDINADSLIEETFKNALEHLQYDCIESDNDSCEQCGNWNHYSKYVAEVKSEIEKL